MVLLSSVSAGGPCVLDWSVSLLYLIHTHTSAAAMHAGSSGAIVTVLGLLPALLVLRLMPLTLSN